jgi:hypothetical protein
LTLGSSANRSLELTPSSVSISLCATVPASIPLARLGRRARVALGPFGGVLLACSSAVPVPAQGERVPAGVWRYEVDAGPGARELGVQVELPPGVPAQLGVDRFAFPFLDALEVQAESGWRALPRSGERWFAPGCRERGCRLRYRYHLGEAAERIDRFAYAGYRSGALLAPPSTFLLAPQDYAGDDLYRVSVRTAPGESFVTGLWRAQGQGDPELGAAAALLFEAPYSAFGRFERERIELGASSIELAIAPGDAPLGVSRDGLRSAVLGAAHAVAAYYGRFPVPAVTLIVLPRTGAEIAGMQLGNGGASIVLFLGAEVQDAELAADWVLVHELLHLGFPTLDRRHLWLAEGLATYQEPLVRARAGVLSEEDVWRGYLARLPEGLPRDADVGLDGAERWGRTYWGGALVFLGLDLELRARSAGRVSLDTASRAILHAGGDTSVRWSLAQTLAVGDAALDAAPLDAAPLDGAPLDAAPLHAAWLDQTARDGATGPALGATSLTAAHERFGKTPVRVDLDALYRRIGVRLDGDRVMLDDAAELAAVRRSLVAPPLQAAHDAQTGFAAPGVPKSTP